MNILPKTITGALHGHNKNACDWGWQSVLAYGCHTSVVVIDTKAVQVIQTLEKHKSPVSKVKWARENYHHTIDAPYTLRLASADTGGQIIVWDVKDSSERASFCEGTKPVLDLEWLSTQDASHDLLVALHPPYSIVLWNADTGIKLWKKTFTDSIVSMTFDPFESSNLALLGNDCILFVNDFSINRSPSSNGRKFYITTPAASGPSPASSSTNLSSGGGEKKIGHRLRRVRQLVRDNKSRSSQLSVEEPEAVTLNECLQMTYLQSRRQHLLLVYPREILILDLDIYQTVGMIPMERSGSPFQQVYPCRQRDVLVCLHENGSISVRVRRRPRQTTSPSAATPVDQIGNFVGLTGGDYLLTHDPYDVIYDLRCQSDPLRVTKHMRAFGLACCMATERQVGLLMSDGRLLIWSLMTANHMPSSTSNVHTQMVLSPLYSPSVAPGASNSDFEFLPPLTHSVSQQVIPHPKISLNDLICQTDVSGDISNTQPQQGRGVILKFVLTGLSCGVAAVPTVIRMCPPVTTKNIHKYRPLAALGSSTGLVQVFNLTTGSLWREYNIHTASVRGIEWVGLSSFLSYSYHNPSSTGLVRNELLLLDLQTGRTTPLRLHKGDEVPIEAIKVSHLKQYFIVMLKEKPFEIWDLKNRTILREMPANFPVITALEWSPTHHKKRSAVTNQETMGSSSLLDSISSSHHILDGGGDSKASQTSSTKEHFFFAESNRMLHHFWVEGNVVKEGSRLPSDSGLGAITCMTWKGETLIMGDADGMLGVWDLKARISRNYPTHRSSIKKVKFAPGKGNLKILCLWSEGLDIWDIKEVRGTSSMRINKEHSKLIDADWAASDKPVVVSSDGCLRVYDLRLKTSSSPMDYAEFADPVFCPYLLSPKAALAMKYTMQHQPWNEQYTLQLTKEYETPEDENFIRAVNDQFDIMPEKIKNFLPICPYGTAQRCLLAAQLFGDEAETTFWTVALQYLKAEKARANCLIHKSSPETPGPGYHSDPYQGEMPGTQPANHRTLLMDTREEEVVTSCSCIKEPLLDTCYDVLCDSKSYQKYQIERLSLHDSKRSTHDQTLKCAENLILLGQFDRAVQLYLETEAENENYYLDSILACLVATVKSTGASQSTIKLVATSLIANNKLSEGVQLLCLINKGIDACRYLITYGEWNQAVWLAKATLPYAEYTSILRRYVDYLCSPTINQKTKAVLFLLSMGQFQQALEILFSMHYYDRAGMFAEACTEFDVLPDTEEIRSLLEKVYLEYARYLLALGNQKAYGYYCNKAAEKAQKVNQEMEWMED